MCLLPSNIEPKDLIASLPHDVEALIVLSTEAQKNMSGNAKLIAAINLNRVFINILTF
jgi:hypothetical protein